MSNIRGQHHIVGGILAIAGGLIPKIFDWWVTSHKETKSTRQRRIEDAVHYAFQYNDWLDKYVTSTAFGASESELQNPESNLLILTKMYLPELEKVWVSVEARATELKAWATQAAQKRLAATPHPGATTLPLPDLTEGYKDTYEAYREALCAFKEKIVELAKEEK